VIDSLLVLSKFLHYFMVFAIKLFRLSPECNCLKRFTGYGQYVGKMDDIIIARLAIVC